MSNLDLIKTLRKMTGAGFTACKKALEESDQDIQKAKIWLSKQGARIANKRADSDTSHGAVAVYADNEGISIVEMNTETDFVAMNEMFQEKIALFTKENKFNNTDELLAHKLSSSSTVSDELNSLVSAIAEKMVIKRCAYIKVDSNNKVGHYVHNKMSDRDGVVIGKSAAIVSASSNAGDELIQQVAMHIVANSTSAISKEEIDQNLVKTEMEVIMSDKSLADKKDEIKQRIINGRLDKFYAEHVLMMQPWVMDDSKLCHQVLNDVSIMRFEHYKLPCV